MIIRGFVVSFPYGSSEGTMTLNIMTFTTTIIKCDTQFNDT
jgi:hypothetical protein